LATPRRQDQIAALTCINANDFCEALGVRAGTPGRRLLQWLIWPAARRFSCMMATYDARVCELGLAAAAAGLVARLDGKVEVTGREYLPAAGPTLFVANHPGLTDSVVLLANLPPLDLRVIAAERPFLGTLPCTGRYMIYLQDDQAGAGLAAVRAATAHLRGGGGLLTFPAGRIEPDPQTMPGAVASLRDWSPSLVLLVRLVPETMVVPVIVAGVISADTLRHPLARLRRNQKDRERLAASLQLAAQVALPTYKPVRVRVAFGRPLCGVDLVRRPDTAESMKSVTEEVRRLIETVAG
jgi:1-acyl-sn-glycerol-3-phosphate acyltransferase